MYPFHAALPISLVSVHLFIFSTLGACWAQDRFCSEDGGLSLIQQSAYRAHGPESRPDSKSKSESRLNGKPASIATPPSAQAVIREQKYANGEAHSERKENSAAVKKSLEPLMSLQAQEERHPRIAGRPEPIISLQSDQVSSQVSKTREGSAAFAEVGKSVAFPSTWYNRQVASKNGLVQSDALSIRKQKPKDEEKTKDKAEDKKKEDKAEDESDKKKEEKSEDKADKKEEDKVEDKAKETEDGKVDGKAEKKEEAKVEDKSEKKDKDKAEETADDKAVDKADKNEDTADETDDSKASEADSEKPKEESVEKVEEDSDNKAEEAAEIEDVESAETTLQPTMEPQVEEGASEQERSTVAGAEAEEVGSADAETEEEGAAVAGAEAEEEAPSVAGSETEEGDAVPRESAEEDGEAKVEGVAEAGTVEGFGSTQQQYGEKRWQRIYWVLVAAIAFFSLHFLYSQCCYAPLDHHHKHQGHATERLSDHLADDAHYTRAGLGKFVDSFSFKSTIVIWILVDVGISVSIVLLEKFTTGNEVLIDKMEYVSIGLLCAFLVEHALYALAFRRMFWRHKWHVFDLVVVFAALLGDTLYETESSILEFVIGLRLCRLVAAMLAGPSPDREGAQRERAPPPLPPLSPAEEAAILAEQERHFPDNHHHAPARTMGLEGLAINAPVFFVPWMFFTLCLGGVGLMCEMLICGLILFFCLGISVMFMVLSRGRGWAWAAYNVLCLLSAVAGAALGYLHRVRGGDRLLTKSEALLIVLSSTFYFFLMMAISVALTRFGVVLLGSSATFARERGWGWNPLMAPHLHFGFDQNFDTGADLVEERVHPKSVAIGLLHHRCYWSGEPAMDFTFWMCNESSFLSCCLSHPVNAFGFFERTLTLVMLVPLIIFPIALIKFLFPEGGISCTIVNLAIFIFPRYLLKVYVKELCTLSDQMQLKTTSGELENSPLAQLNVFADLKDLRKAARPKDALRREVVFFIILANAAICQAVCISLYIQAWTGELTVALWASYEGLVYAFILELVLLVIVPHRLSDGQWVVGFFGQWWAERLRPEYGGKRGSPLRGSLAGAPVMNDPMQMW